MNLKPRCPECGSPSVIWESRQRIDERTGGVEYAIVHQCEYEHVWESDQDHGDRHRKSATPDVC